MSTSWILPRPSLTVPLIWIINAVVALIRRLHKLTFDDSLNERALASSESRSTIGVPWQS